MKTKCKYIVLAVLLMFVAVIYAVTVRFYDSKQLSSTLVTSITQDGRGYVWIGTEYGLNKFDGVRYTQYYNEEGDTTSLGNNAIEKLFTDQNGRLWIINKGNVQRYVPHGDSFANVQFPQELGRVYCKDMQQAKDGTIYILSDEKGLFRLNEETMQASGVEQYNKYLCKTKSHNLLIDRQQRLWVCTDNGVYLFDGKVRTYFGDSLQYGDRISALTDDAQGRVYVFSHRNAFVFDNKSGQFHKYCSLSIGMNPIHVYKNRKGNIVLVADKVGIYLFDVAHKSLIPQYQDSEEWKNWNQQDISTYYEDQDGQTWVGCRRKGAMTFRDDAYPFHYVSLSNDEQTSLLFADSYGNVYVGRGYDGLQVVGENKSLEGKVLLPGKMVLSVCELTPDKWWVGVRDGGAYIVNPKSGESKKVEATEFARVKSIAKDRQGNVYTVMFMQGIKSFDASGEHERQMCKGGFKLYNDYVNILFTDSHNRIWTGTYYGFEVYDATHDRQVDIPMDSTLRSATVYSIEETQDGTMWLGTNRGLYAWQSKDGSWTRYTVDNGLPNNIVCQVVDTKDGNLWMSTFKGLARLTVKTGKWQKYYYGNGLQYTNYARSVGCRTKYGVVCFGNDNGFTYFMPKNVVNKNFMKGITLTGVLFKDKQLSAKDKSGGSYVMDCAVEDAKDLTFSYEDNTFTLQFSTMDYRDLENVTYQYRFSNEKKGVWHSSQTGNSSIMFTNLSWGMHHLEVRAMDNGAYSPVRKLSIHILPPWYASWWAYVFYLLVVAALGYLYWHNQRNKRLAMDNEMKVRLFVDISHEFRSPLTLIKSPLDTMLKRNYDAETMRGLNNIKRNTDRLLLLVNQILSIRKIEKGQMRLHFAETNVVEFVESVLDNFEYEAEKRGIALKLEHAADDIKAWIDWGQFDKVISNLVSNAFKYVEKGGEICVSLQMENDASGRTYLLLKVQDTGSGIDEKQINRIFERFYQTTSSEVGQLGFGIGLNLTRKLVNLHRGKIEVHNRKDTHGAEFVVTLPTDAIGLLAEDKVEESFFIHAQEQNAADRESVLLEQTVEKPARHKTNYHVVVVDDDEQMLKFLQEELGMVYHVKAFNNGADALECIIQDQPDLVVTDVKMPEMDGFTLLKRIKSNTKTSHVPVILLTSEVEHKSRMKGFEHGADAYVDKPFDVDELEARMASLIANRLRVKGKFSGMQEQKGVIADIEMKGNTEQLMERVMKVTKERFTDPDFNVEALASEVGISRVQLHRKVKETMGITVGDFIRNLRLQQAARLLEKGDLNISQITYAVGLTNPTHFSAAFKKYFGVSPKLYMQKLTDSEADGEECNK